MQDAPVAVLEHIDVVADPQGVDVGIDAGFVEVASEDALVLDDVAHLGEFLDVASHEVHGGVSRRVAVPGCVCSVAGPCEMWCHTHDMDTQEEDVLKHMLQRHAEEVAFVRDKSDYRRLLERHAYELKTHPLPNYFKIGNDVSVYGHGLGKIHALTAHGTVRVSFYGCSLVRDVHPHAVSLRSSGDHASR